MVRREGWQGEGITMDDADKTIAREESMRNGLNREPETEREAETAVSVPGIIRTESGWKQIRITETF